MESCHYEVWKHLVSLNVQNISFKHQNYPHYHLHCVLKYNLYALQKYGVEIKKLESDIVNEQSLYTLVPPPTEFDDE